MDRFLLPALLLCLLAFSHCNKDKKEPVPQTSSIQLQFVDMPDQYAVFDTIHYAFTALTPSGLVSATSTLLVNGELRETGFTAGLDSARTSFGDTLSFILGPDEIAQTISFTLTLTDLLGETLADTLATVVADTDIDYHYGARMGGFNNSENLGSFYAYLEDTVYFPNSIRNKQNVLSTIDFVYCYDGTSKRSVTAPTSTWIEKVWTSQNSNLWPLGETENTTILYDLGESSAFEGIVSTNQIIDLISGKTEVDSLTFVAENRVIGFKLDSLRGGKVGVMKVVATSGNSVTTGTITVDSKVQK